ncbi:MAG: GNAT family N-acetyltransferase [Chloroflexi bacterium]|nr:GNAT family N-acetyltransferase [Chloroflexota bacterium]
MMQRPLALHSPDTRWRIRPVRLTDIDALQRYCWPERSYSALYNLASRALGLAKEGNGLGIVVLDSANSVRAYGQLTAWPNCAEITDLIVSEPLRNRGIGTTMIQYLLRAAREMQATCVEIGANAENTRALALYRRLGFSDSHVVQVRERGSPQQLVYLRLELTGSPYDQ